MATANGCGLTLLSGAAFSSSATLTGFVVGGGVEWQMPDTALPGHWRARLEYLYHGFDQPQSGSSLYINGAGAPLLCHVGPPTCSAQYGFNGNFNIRTVRAGLTTRSELTSDLPITKPRATSEDVRFWPILLKNSGSKSRQDARTASRPSWRNRRDVRCRWCVLNTILLRSRIPRPAPFLSMNDTLAESSL